MSQTSYDLLDSHWLAPIRSRSKILTLLISYQI